MSSSLSALLLIAAVSMVASAPLFAKPVFDGTFGANCPPCKEFGQTVLKKLYAADGISTSVDFQMHSAIRSAGSPTKDHSWGCPDEDPGCPMTKWFICAVDGWNATTTTQDQRVNFLTCWDDARGSSEAKAKSCSKQVGFDFDAVSACNSGPKGEALQMAAAEAFEKRFPSHAHSGMYEVPHLFINGEDLGENRDYATVLKKLCSTGIKAGACKGVVDLGRQDAIEVQFIGQSFAAPAKFNPDDRKCHYDDPFQPAGCQAGETNVTISGVTGSFCSPQCNPDNSCPTDTCPGTVAKPQCALQDQSGNRYCALICDPKSKGPATCSSDEHMSKCQPISNTGLCTYYS